MVPLEVLGVQADPAQGTPVVLLQEAEEPHRVLPIFVGAPEAISIAIGLQHAETARPLTHDLLIDVLANTDARLERVEVVGVDDGVFLAELELAGPGGTRRISSRPSDAIALAVRLGLPMYASEQVLDEAGAVLVLRARGDDDLEVIEALGPGTPLDDDAIEAEIGQWRDFLDTLDPSDFAEVGLGELWDDDPEQDPDDPDQPGDHPR